MRAFVALELPKNLRERMGEVSRALNAGGAKVRWVHPDQMHLTLRFLGDISMDQAETMKRAVRDAVALQPEPLKLGIGGLGAFPNRRNPRVIWVGINPHAGLATVQRIIDEAAVGTGVEPENRAWAPHLTLGRIKFVENHSPLLKRLKSVRVETFYYTCDTVTLYESTLTPEGPLYRPLEQGVFGSQT